MWRRAIVLSHKQHWHGSLELEVALEDGSAARALAYPELVGTPDIGDTVLLTAAAHAKGLGTGGYMFVAAIADHMPSDSPDEPGHIVKARYTPLQYLTLGVDEQESPYHGVLQEADSLEGMPVALADLHSSLAPLLCGIRARTPSARIAYIMLDGGALPLWFSRAVSELKAAGWLATTISAGQSFGGDFEAVNVHTALLAAKHVAHADAAIVAQGPGNLGTGTKWGFSGTQVGDAINAVNALGGRAIAVLRMSQGDARSRHYGLSHHSVTALTRVALSPALCPVPLFDGHDELVARVDDTVQATLFAQLEELFNAPHLTRCDVSTQGLARAFAASPVKLSTMGRSLNDDPLAFLAAGVAGYAVADMLA